MFVERRKMVGVCVAAGLVLAGCDELPKAQPDLGGVTFDFQQLSDARFSIPKTGDPGNFVDGSPWQGEVCDVHHAKVKHDNPVRKAIKDGMRWHQQDGVCHVEKLPELEKIAGQVDGKPLAQSVSGTFQKLVLLPDDKGGDYRISFRYKMRHSLGEHGFYLVYFKKRDAQGRWIEAKDGAGSCYTAYPFKDDWSGWNVFSRTVKIPAGCAAFELQMRIDGIGDLMFKDVGFAKVKSETRDVSLILSPQDALGDEFVLSRGQPGGIGFSIRKNADRKISLYDCRFLLELPAGVDFVGSSFGDVSTVRTEKLPSGGTVTTFAPSKTNWFQFSKEFTTWNRMLALVKTDLPVGPAGTAKLRFTLDGKNLAQPVELKLSVIEEIRAIKPKRYQNGISTAGKSTFFQDAAADDLFARFMGACGVDWLICCEFTPTMLASWRKAGIRTVTPTGALANGYYLDSEWQKRPKDEAFVKNAEPGDVGRTWDNYLDRSACPLSVIEERPFFLTNTVAKRITAALKGTDGMWSNWEPFMFKRRGCDCERCRAAFAAWHAKTGGSVGDFRSLQHGKLVKVIDKHVRRATGGERSLGFIPGVSWREMTSSWREKDPSAESRPIDYADALKWIDPWGPYVCWDAANPYLYQKRGPLAHFIAAKDIREQVDRDFPNARPKLMSFPHGVQGLSWVTQPEHLEMALDSFFFNRWEASVVYFFPQGLDARFWKAFAQATTRAAKCEDGVLDGTPASDACTLTPVGEYAAPSGYVTTYLPKYRDVPMLQHAAYDWKGGRLVAAFNFWDKGEAFFTLRLRGLATGDYRVVDEDGVLYPKSRFSSAWSASDLANGVKLVVGAARTKAFFVMPEKTAPQATKALSQEDVETLYRTRQPTLSAAAEADAKYERANTVTVNTKAEL